METKKSKKGSTKKSAGPKVKFIDAPGFGVDEMDKAIEYLEKEGYVRITNVLGSQEIEHGKDLFWKFMTGLGTGIKRDDITTWVNDNWPNTFSNGIIDQYGIGQSDLLWYLRANDNVQKVFSKIWNTNQLLTSFDGCNAFRPTNPLVIPEKKAWATKGGWYHIDQGISKIGFHCVQGFVTLMDVDQVSGGLVVDPKSHLRQEEILEKVLRKKKNANWVFISKTMVDELVLEPVIIKAKAGDMLLWDSRTIHCNAPGEKVSGAKHKDLIRLVAYISMLPAEGCPESVIEKRKKGVAEGVSTSHWANAYEPKSPGRWTRELQKLKPIKMDNWVPPLLNEVQKKLAGILPYNEEQPIDKKRTTEEERQEGKKVKSSEDIVED